MSRKRPGVEIREAVAINDAGQVVVDCYRLCSSFEAGLLTPDAGVVPCRKGNVGLASAGISNPHGLVDVVFVNGSSGDPVERRLSVTDGEPASLHVDPAPDARTPHYALWIYAGESRGDVDVEVSLPRDRRF